MEIDHVHFYVENAALQRDWFIQNLGYCRLASVLTPDTRTEVLRNGSIYFLVSSPLARRSPVFDYLQCHPAGVADVAFRVENLQSLLNTAVPISTAQERTISPSGYLKWATVKGWGALSHTLIENTSPVPFCETLSSQDSDGTRKTLQVEGGRSQSSSASQDRLSMFSCIDHVVLNVAAGTLTQAADWYCKTFGLEVQQTFNIRTPKSGLKSQVLAFAGQEAYLNINEPTTANSQIQDFLNANRGSGIQHIALRTAQIVQAVAQLRQRGQSFLSVPASYYTQLKARLTEQGVPLLQSQEILAIQAQQILADWQKDSKALLLQIFTRPIFKEPTFFLS